MTKTPLVSVCINCYNAEHTLLPTLQSVLSQTYPNLQVIVVDDCSTDGTWDILQSIDDSRIECVRLAENGHISNANNEALRRVRGDFVAHLDADDRWVPDKIEKQLAFLQEHPEYGACFSVAEMVDEHDNPVEDHRFRAENRDQAALLRHFLTVGNYLCHSSMFARREIIDRVGEHDLTLLYLHDFDYWIRMGLLCDIYISPEKLVYYRLSTESNSAMLSQKLQAHYFETAQIAYRIVRECPDDLFAKAFADRLRLKGEHTPQQMELEKAFLLTELIPCLPQNPAIGLRRLHELMSDKQYADIARHDFGFTIHDLYKLAQTAVYHDALTHRALADRAMGLEESLRSLQTDYQTLMQHADALSADRDRIKDLLDSTCRYADSVTDDRNNLRAHIQLLAAQNAQQSARADLAEQRLALAHGSLSWKITKPLRAFRSIQRVMRSSRHPMTKDGRPAACKVMLYGYYGHNLGDDLFFRTLFTRYPDTVFVAVDAPGYEAVFAPYPNVYVYQSDRFGASRRETFETFLLSQVDAVVHIGGSIYQQIGAWENDLRQREKRHSKKRPFFSISSNFGPYHTEAYRTFWHKRFAIARDICMRDRYSHELFGDLDTVRYVPDLLFSLPLPQAETVKGKLFLSVIEPSSPAHPFPQEQCERYFRTLTAVATAWLENGHDVVLSSFCSFEQDDTAVDTLVQAIPADLHGKLSVVSYDGSGSFDNVLTSLASSEYVLATRFHAGLFGMSASKTVVPVAYNQKVTHLLNDIGFDGYIADFETMDADAILSALTNGQPFDVSAQKEAAIGQLARLDDYIRSKGGAVI